MGVKVDCTCGREIEFMDHISCFPQIVRVGCPTCKIMFYTEGTWRDFPHMTQFDITELRRNGTYAIKGECYSRKNEVQLRLW